MRKIQRKNGFALILVLALIPLLGMVAVVLNTNSRILITQSRRLALKTHAQLACESGIAWIENQEEQQFSDKLPVVLQINHKDKNITCTIELVSQADDKSVFNITGHTEDKRFSQEYKYQLVSKR